MRTDKSLEENVLNSKDWNDDQPDVHLTYNVFETIEENGQKRMVMNSLSGWERNHLFMNRNGKFDDVSLISGMDSDADTRAHCTFDFDRDGFSDVAIVNGTKPQLQLFRNRIGELTSQPNEFVAVNLVGGNYTDQPSKEWSCRDAVGTLVEVASGELNYIRELRFGEGFAGQNSTTLILGVMGNENADLKIRWLSGKTQEFKNVQSGKLLTIFEDVSRSASGSGIDVAPYRSDVQPANHPTKPGDFESFLFDDDLTTRKYRLVTSMATWCSACKKMAPQLGMIRKYFDNEIELIGLPIDPVDTREKLEEYVESNSPAYQLMLEISDEQREQFKRIVSENRGKAALPSTLLINADGRVIESWLGVPSISEIAAITESIAAITESADSGSDE